MPEYKAPCVHIYMPDGSTVQAKRFSALTTPGIADFKQMYQALVAIFVRYNANMGDILADPEGLKILLDMAAIVPVGDGQGIDVETLLEAGDIEQVCTVFVTASMQREGKNRGEYRKDPKDPDGAQLPYEPSELAKLNQLDFFGYVGQALRTEQEKSEVLKAQIATAIETVKANGSSDKPQVVEIQK